MKTGKILIPSLAGTSAMTIFSYLASNVENKNYREPEILGSLIKRLPFNISDNTAQISGWSLHYSIGTLFVAAFNEIWKRNIVKPSISSGALLGIGSGVIGVVGWKIMFNAHPNPPEKNLKPYFLHLMMAHIAFGVFSALTYKSNVLENKI